MESSGGRWMEESITKPDGLDGRVFFLLFKTDIGRATFLIEVEVEGPFIRRELLFVSPRGGSVLCHGKRVRRGVERQEEEV